MASSWLDISPASPFSIANIPFGVISTPGSSSPVPAVAIGDFALDLKAFANGGGFSELPDIHPHLDVFSQTTLNAFAALGRPIHSAVRKYLQSIFAKDGPHAALLQDNELLRKTALLQLSSITTHLPLKIGDYTDFYAGLNHAYNVGVLFRGADNALQPNYTHLPVGYHGRASSVVVSGTPIRRPRGQILPAPGAKQPVFSACKKLDIELELAAFIATPNALGHPVDIADAAEHIFGVVLMNDWSARDVQAWEYVPLGPFNAKNFGTTISPWVVLLDALEPFRAAPLVHGDGPRELLPYLQEQTHKSVYDIALQVELREAESTERAVLTRTSGKNLLFSFPQMVAHHTVTGCNLGTGDLLGSGTISGKEAGSEGSLLEQTKNGKQAVTLQSGLERRFLEDGDEVIITGVCGEEGSYVGFGECTGVILPALE